MQIIYGVTKYSDFRQASFEIKHRDLDENLLVTLVNVLTFLAEGWILNPSYLGMSHMLVLDVQQHERLVWLVSLSAGIFLSQVMNLETLSSPIFP
jgi:hypothetical protein